MEQTEIEKTADQAAALRQPAPASLKPIHFIATLALAGLGILAAVMLTSQSVDERGQQMLSAQQSAHEAALKEAQNSSAEKDQKIEALTSSLKESYEKHKTLLDKNQELDAKVKAFQGSMNVSKGQILPSPDSTLPVNISPVFQSAESPLIKDGSRLFALRREGIFTVQTPPASVRNLASGQIKVPEAARSLAAKPAPRAGSVKLLFPDREFADAQKPTIKWQRQKGMLGGVQCIILDREGKVVARSEADTAELWQVNLELLRGHTYTYRLLSPNPANPDEGQVLAESSFYLLSEAESSALAKKLNEAGDSALIRTAVYAEIGLLASAEWEAGRFAKASPNIDLGEKILGQIKQLRPKR